MRRFEIHNIVGITLIAFGFAVLFLRSDIAGVTGVLYEYVVVGVPLSDIVGLGQILGGALYLVPVWVSQFDRFWWHWICASSLIGYIIPAYIFWIEHASGVAFTLYTGLLLCFYGLVAYHHRYEVIPESVRRILPGGDDD